jgi:alkaline phosphatase D
MSGSTRRAALGAAAAAAAAASVPAWPGAGFAAVQRERPFRQGRFRSGVGSGDPTQHGALLWTRLHSVDGPGTLGWEIAAGPGFGNVVESGRVRVGPGSDWTVHVPVRSRRLEAGRPYWYRFHTANRHSPVGRFKTLRPPDSREPVRIAVYSCQDYESGFYAAHRDMAGQDLDLVVMVGDYIYERAAAGGVRADRTGANGDGDVQTLDEYRRKYRLYQRDPDLQAMHAAHAHRAFWDSHDVEPHPTADRDTDQYGSKRRVSHQQRLRNGVRSFLEAMPQAHPADRRRHIYEAIPLGALATVILTDEQLYADPYPCGFSFPPQGCPEASDPARTYLGATQKRWLEERLAERRGKWKLYCGGTMMMSFDFTPGTPYNTGQWDGYVAERRELAEFLLDRRIDNVIRLSGDIHTFFAGQVTTTGRSDGTPAAVEFIGGSISSLGIPEGLAAGAGGEVDPELIDAFVENAILTNPHIAYTDMEHRGYKIVEAREDELRVSFRAPADARVRDSPVQTLAEFRVPDGEPRVEPL